MQIEEEHAIDWVLPTSASCVGCEDLAEGQTIRNGDILLNNIEKKQDFKLVAPSNLTPLLLNHFGEKGLTIKWFMLVGPFKYVTPRYRDSPFATDLQRAIFIYFL